MPKASNNQQAFLREHGIEPPAPQKYWHMKKWSWQDAARIIAFLKDGNGAGEATTLEERRDLYLAVRKKYEGRTIVHLDPIIMPKNESGIVRSLILCSVPKTAGQVESECKKGARLNEVFPFEFYLVNEGDPIDYEGHIYGGDLDGPLVTTNKRVKGKLFDVMFECRIQQLQKERLKMISITSATKYLGWIYGYCEKNEQNGSAENLKHYIQLIQLFLENERKPEQGKIAEFFLVRAKAIEYLAGLYLLKIDLEYTLGESKEQAEKLKPSHLCQKAFSLISPERLKQLLILDTYVLEIMYPEDN